MTAHNSNHVAVPNLQYNPQTTVLPPYRVRLALEAVDLYRIIEQGTIGSGGRELQANEQVVLHAANDILRMYFSGEMDYGDLPLRTYRDPALEDTPMATRRRFLDL